jgi:hypothetical protein
MRCLRRPRRAPACGPGRLGGEDTEAGEIHPDVGQDCENLTEHNDHGAAVTEGCQAGQQRGHDHGKAEHAQEQPGAPQALQVPHLRHREQARLSEACRSPGQGEQADYQAEDAGAPELMDVTGELMADQRDLPGHGVQNLLAQREVAGGNQAKDGHQDEQQREQGNEACMSKVGSKHPRCHLRIS